MPTIYATWNPSDKHAGVTLSGGNLTATGTGWVGVRGTISKTAGKHYFEVLVNNVGVTAIGIATADQPLNETVGNPSDYGWGLQSNGYKTHAGFAGYSLTYTTADVVMVAVDLDNGEIWMGKNGSWTGDPAAGTDPMWDSISGTLFPMVSLAGGSNVTANFGESAFSHSAPSGYASGWLESPETFEVDIGAESGIQVGMESLHLADELLTEAGTQISFDGLRLREDTAIEAGIQATFDGARMRDDLDADAGINANFGSDGSVYQTGVEAEAGVQADMEALHLADALSGSAGIQTSVSRIIEVNRGLEAEAGIEADFDGFNWSDFLRAYRDRISVRYILTLSDGILADIEIPISSFQGRFRTGDPTYLSVVVPGNDQYDDIVARDGGALALTMQYLIDGTVYHAEAICTVDLEAIDIDEGASSVSLTLTGHRTVSHTAKTSQLIGASYSAIRSGKMRYRCTPDLYLRPGDTVVVGDDTFTAGVITWMVNPMSQIMEVAEA